jgi:hypothetical protein
MALTTVADARGNTWSYSGFDHMGRRRVNYQFNADGSVRYELHFYDLAGRTLGTTTGVQAGGVSYTQAEAIYWVDDEPVFRMELTNGGSYWSLDRMSFLYNDPTGTPRLMTRVDGGFANPVVTYRATNEPFMAGPPATSAGSTPLRMRAPGQWADLGTELQGASGALSATMSALVANHARVYDPGQGAYGQREPMVSVGRWAGVEGVSPWFGYAGYRPNELVDPDGELVDGVFFVRSRRLVLRDRDTGQSVAVRAFTADLAPIPEGAYAILHSDRVRAPAEGSRTTFSAGQFRLDPIDGDNYNDRLNFRPQTRVDFRLHWYGRGGNTGCISTQTDEEFLPVERLIRATRTRLVPERRAPGNFCIWPFCRPPTHIRAYGLLHVVNR